MLTIAILWVCFSNSSTTDHEVHLVVPSTTHLLTSTYEAPSYASAVTPGGPLIHASNSTCLTPATTEASAADDDDSKDDNDDEDQAESPATSSTVRPTTASTSCVRPAFHV